MQICPPALTYLVLSIIGIVYAISVKFQAMTIALKLVFVGLWTWLLNLLCKKGFTTVSWILVLLPFILLFVMVLLLGELILASALSSEGMKGRGQQGFDVKEGATTDKPPKK